MPVSAREPTTQDQEEHEKLWFVEHVGAHGVIVAKLEAVVRGQGLGGEGRHAHRSVQKRSEDEPRQTKRKGESVGRVSQNELLKRSFIVLQSTPIVKRLLGRQMHFVVVAKQVGAAVARSETLSTARTRLSNCRPPFPVHH